MSAKEKLIAQLDDLAEAHGVEIPTTGTEAELKARVKEWQAKSVLSEQALGNALNGEGEATSIRHSGQGFVAAHTMQLRDSDGECRFFIKGAVLTVDEQTLAALIDEGLAIDPNAKQADE